MRNTTYYNMIVAEGTDLVNPLTQIFPNFDTIDAAMEANKESGITIASEVTTGGVHAITRTDSSVNAFRFTATSAWTTGDTMTLDGSAVTVHLTDGTTPKSGDYVIGAEVVGLVNGSLVTLITSKTFDGVSSFNSRNGVVLPTSGDYTANMIGYNNTASGLVATNEQDAIDELAGKGFKALWENTNPGAAFPSQNIVLSDGGYKALCIVAYMGTWGSYIRTCSTIIQKGIDAQLFILQTRVDSYGMSCNDRHLTYVDDTHYTVETGSGAVPGTPASSSDSIIPLVVYGIY